MNGSAQSSVFIGSSSEALGVANALQDNLHKNHEVVVWEQDVFQLGQNQFDSLVKAASEFDFAIFIATEDDFVEKRGNTYSVPRDNVILEIGLFIGAIGRDRVFVVSPEGADISLPSDMAGITTGRFVVGSDERLASSLAPVARSIAQRIAALGRRSRALDSTVFVAAVCYKIIDDTILIRLIKTSRGRWMFPKGRVQAGEPSSTAALRHAEDEGGIMGRPDYLETTQFRLLKNDTGHEQIVFAHLVRTTREFEVDEKFREPTWFTFPNAEVALKEGRTAKYAKELRDVLEWAKTAITSQIVAGRRVAGTVPIRFDANGEPEILLVTSSRNKSWVIPKGEIEEGESARDAALRESLEEAGVVGSIGEAELGNYEYTRASVRNVVAVYALFVKEERSDWRDRGIRDRRWFSAEEAKDLVVDHSLRPLFNGAVRDLRSMDRLPGLP